ncbi:MAG: hypothetical protein RBT15_03680 [Gudongella sp.]|jgi:hypothetical protein|nr:hypothetical protein [Gudongella sp.]
MRLEKVTKENRRQFIQFYRNQYLNKDNKRNSGNRIVEDIVKGKSILSRSVGLEPVMIVDGDKILMAAIIAHAQRMDDILQIAFFESLEYNGDAFELLFNHAKELAVEKGVSKISASLNIHVNYGLGFLDDGSDKWQSFGSSHNPPFYNKYFQDRGFDQINLVSFYRELDSLEDIISEKLEKKLDDTYRVRTCDFRNFKKEIELYSQVNNIAFAEHPFYYERDTEEDWELFKDFKYLLKEENLLFIEKDNETIGFLLWYPDFNKLIKPNESLGLKTVVRNRLFPERINGMKIVEIGVIPSEWNKGAILALFNDLHKRVRGKYDYFESSWILEENKKSLGLGLRWMGEEYKTYKAYLLNI